MRIAVLLLIPLLALSAAACSTTPKENAAPKTSTYGGEGNPKIKFGEKSDTAGGQGEGSDGGASAFAWALTPFENIVYLPWKLVGGGIKGGADGVRAGFDKDRMPAIGLLFSPVNLVVGFLTGAVETVASKPVLITPDDSFGHAMAQPTKHSTTIWWYE
jgi:hypothetical protein